MIKEVKTFVVDAQYFRKDWEASGPMVTGLDPMEAVDRLRKFQQMFEVRRAGGPEGREGEGEGGSWRAFEVRVEGAWAECLSPKP